MSVAATIAAEGDKIVNELPASPYVYGATAIVVLLSLLGITYAFRSVGTRHR
ncbi:hypothetical protein [Luteimicrobium subarcticum]|uniref:Uncharacterized protein n=1 Tax=Luteimicrobium subarcticum TaxID=620910 RepID=A0A2M8WQS0_9MICO|nr:hypothetical protein [Luteimicrobium subarcticum]PJI93285.1 hypothetical protein CLV34_1853 [Luteimicrobium subarcticum]